jgi:hypothetical protein
MEASNDLRSLSDRVRLVNRTSRLFAISPPRAAHRSVTSYTHVGLSSSCSESRTAGIIPYVGTPLNPRNAPPVPNQSNFVSCIVQPLLLPTLPVTLRKNGPLHSLHVSQVPSFVTGGKTDTFIVAVHWPTLVCPATDKSYRRRVHPVPSLPIIVPNGYLVVRV